MDTSEAAFEAEADLDQAALQQERRRKLHRAGEISTRLANGALHSSNTGQHEDDGAGETSPLLPRDEGAEDPEPPLTEIEDFSHLPWYKRPNIYWVLGPFFLMALAYGGVIAPKVNLTMDLICRQYMADRQLADPTFTFTPVDFENGGNDQCGIPEVQARVSIFLAAASLIGGLLSAITAPKLGALSDRYGRKIILVTTSIGTMANEIITIIAATYPEQFPVDYLLVGYALDGLTGSFLIAMAIANAYAADCTPSQERNVVFGYFHGCLFTGLALGPVLAGYLVKLTGRIVIVFYVLLAVHTFFVLFISLAVPESVSKRRRKMAQEKHSVLARQRGPNQDWVNRLRSLNLLEPLKILWPTGPGVNPALPLNLIVLAAVDTIVFGVAMGSMNTLVVYTRYKFGWESFESGRFMSIVNTCRVFCLVVALPIITRLVRGRSSASEPQPKGSDFFDLIVIRVAVLFDTLGYLGYSLAGQGGTFILSGVVAAIGGIGSPTLQAALTKHVPAEQTGQLLGATGLLHGLARVVAPPLFGAIYAATVGKFTPAVFVCLACTFGLAFVISWFIRAHVHYDEDTVDSSAGDTADAT